MPSSELFSGTTPVPGKKHGTQQFHITDTTEFQAFARNWSLGLSYTRTIGRKTAGNYREASGILLGKLPEKIHLWNSSNYPN